MITLQCAGSRLAGRTGPACSEPTGTGLAHSEAAETARGTERLTEPSDESERLYCGE